MSTKQTPQTIDPQIVITHIENLLAQIKSKYPQITDTQIKNNKKHSSIYTNFNNKNPIPTIKMQISIKNLLAPSHMINGKVPVTDLIDYTTIVFHEEHHVIQYTNLFQQLITADWIVDMARHDLVARYFPSYYKNNYRNLAIEADAEENAIKNTAEYFEKNPIIQDIDFSKYDIRGILLDFEKQHDKMYLPRNKEFNTYNEMVGALSLKKKVITRQLSSVLPIKYDTSNPELEKRYAFSERVFNSPRYANYRFAYENATNGIERDKALLQVILHEYGYAVGIPKCLERECRTYLKAIHKRINTERTLYRF